MTTPSDTKAGQDPVLRGIRFAGFGIFGILMLHTMVWASEFLVPITGAVLGYFVLNKPRRFLERFGIKPIVTAAIFTALIMAMIALAMLRLSAPVSEFITDLPALVKQIDRQLAAEDGTLKAVNDAADAADEMMNPKEEDGTVEVKVVERNGVATSIAGVAPGLLGQIGFSLLLMFFLVSSGDLFIRKTVQSVRRFQDKRRALAIFHRIEDRLGRYLGGITAINAALGICIAAAMLIWDMPSPFMIGAMAFLLNFVPFIGALIGAFIAAALAFVSLGGIWPAVGVWMTYMALTSLEGQVITPMLISRHMKLNTTVVFLSVAFFAWIWSVMGMVVALPVLTVIKIACDEIDGLKTLGFFLGQETAPLSDRPEKDA